MLEEYWGVGPKTRDLLADSLGEEDAVEAIERSDVRRLVDAGLPRGRATRIVRRAKGGEGLDVLTTRDSRDVYKSLLERIGDHAVTDEAADRVTVMTPFTETEKAERRLGRVEEARDAVEAHGEELVGAFEGYDETDRARVETALRLREAGVGDIFDGVASLDEGALRDAVEALGSLDGEDGTVARGADDDLDTLRDRLEAVRELEDEALDFAERLSTEALDADELREGFVDHVVTEADVTYERARDAVETEALDATDFVTGSLRNLLDSVRGDVEGREEQVAGRLREAVEENRDAVEEASEVVREVAFVASLARFADAHDMTSPEFVDEGVAVRGARNLALVGRGEDVQPVDYAVGADEVAEGDVAVLTGANSGGKTTVLETLCEVVLLAGMGVPVPADEARVSVFDDVVFHRRHSSFNAGVLESTLRSVVPPLTDGDDALMLVDEFEAITEPGSAADLLHGLVTLTVDRDAVGVFVTHLADDLEPLPDEARVDGIFAEGLDDELELDVDYQPRFGTVGRSTPEFIVSRLIARSDGRDDRAGYDVLARSVGVEKVQRTLDEV
ncbi:DNA mismatch repair protein [Haladaptatus sp. F3-133]|jgi:DNA mismatch repair protein MutS2|uniref:DNA mismatch repair protein n=1 Tax=Halorutilus salinus TaxID=2487751 RepID=A0A9Q4GIC8_9EURY|nr:DNA mismatch repair protein [Halorutilus salinus]MCX2818181.1 DNA mismatch repair protein [Halorutilus salinus]